MAFACRVANPETSNSTLGVHYGIHASLCSTGTRQLEGKYVSSTSADMSGDPDVRVCVSEVDVIWFLEPDL